MSHFCDKALTSTTHVTRHQARQHVQMLKMSLGLPLSREGSAVSWWVGLVGWWGRGGGRTLSPTIAPPKTNTRYTLLRFINTCNRDRHQARSLGAASLAWPPDSALQPTLYPKSHTDAMLTLWSRPASSSVPRPAWHQVVSTHATKRQSAGTNDSLTQQPGRPRGLGPSPPQFSAAAAAEHLQEARSREKCVHQFPVFDLIEGGHRQKRTQSRRACRRGQGSYP